MREGDGVAVITGCAHNGILNIVTTVQQRLHLPIYSVVGGIHLKDTAKERIVKTIKELKNFGVRRFALGHCSGEEVHNYIDDKLSDFKISTGVTINFC